MSNKKYRTKADPGYTETPKIDAEDHHVRRLFRELGGGYLTDALEAAVVTVQLFRDELEDLRSRRAKGDDQPERKLTISPTVGVRAIRAVADLVKNRAALLEECRYEIEIIRGRERAAKAANAAAAAKGSPVDCPETAADVESDDAAGDAGETPTSDVGEAPALRTAGKTDRKTCRDSG